MPRIDRTVVTIVLVVGSYPRHVVAAGRDSTRVQRRRRGCLDRRSVVIVRCSKQVFRSSTTSPDSRRWG